MESNKLFSFTDAIDTRGKYVIESNFFERYKFIIPSEVVSKDPESIDISTEFDENYTFEKLPEENQEFEWIYKRKVKVVWGYKYWLGQREYLYFDFWVYGNINITREYFSVEVLDPQKIKLRENIEQKIETIKHLGITKIDSNSDSDYLKPNLVSKFIDVVRVRHKIHPYNDFELFQDILYVNQDLAFQLAEISLFKPYVQDFLESYQYFKGEKRYTYFHTTFDKMYLSVASQAIQSMYIYWEKIGYLLNNHFGLFDPLNSNVYFSRVVHNLLSSKTDEESMWFNNFRINEYEKLKKNERRISSWQRSRNKVHSWMDGKNIQ
jgi:hypothetical protein